MHKTPAEWAAVVAEAVTSGSTAQATNVLQMALDDIQALARGVERWKQVVRDARSGSKGKHFGEQARFVLPDPDYRAPTPEEIERAREADKPRGRRSATDNQERADD